MCVIENPVEGDKTEISTQHIIFLAGMDWRLCIIMEKQRLNSVMYYLIAYTVKPVLRDHLKIDKTKVLNTNGSLIKVESIANALLEHFAILLTCIK